VTLLVSDEVALAVATGAPIVALETSVIGQGLPYPRNLECIERMGGAIRNAGAVPAWTGIVDGAIRALSLIQSDAADEGLGVDLGGRRIIK
jgi:pseudouridine-5'-phosphate glycosidase